MANLITLTEKNAKTYEQLRANRAAIQKLSFEEMDAIIDVLRSLQQAELVSEESLNQQLQGFIPAENAQLINPSISTPAPNATGEEGTNALWVRNRISELQMEAMTYTAVPLTHRFYGGNEHWVKWVYNPLQRIASHTVVSDNAVQTQGTSYDIHGLGDGQSALLILTRGPSAENAVATVKFNGCNLSKDFEVQTGAGMQTLVTITRTGDVYYADSTPILTIPKARLAKPENFRASSVTSTSVTLEWNAVPNATSYRIGMNASSGWHGRGGTQGDPTGTTYTKTGLTPGGTYSFAIQAHATSHYFSEFVVIEVTLPTA